MRLKLYGLQKHSNILVGEITTDHKKVVNTKSLNDDCLYNGKTLTSNYKSDFSICLLKSYDDNGQKGSHIIEFNPSRGTIAKFYIKPSFLKLIYLKLLFKLYPIQRIDGGVRTVFEVIGFILTAVITWYTSKC
jgi:hypothetical protein